MQSWFPSPFVSLHLVSNYTRSFYPVGGQHFGCYTCIFANLLNRLCSFVHLPSYLAAPAAKPIITFLGGLFFIFHISTPLNFKSRVQFYNGEHHVLLRQLSQGGELSTCFFRNNPESI